MMMTRSLFAALLLALVGLTALAPLAAPAQTTSWSQSQSSSQSSSQAGAPSQPLPADQAFQLTVVPQADGGREFRFAIAPGYYLYREHFRATTPEGEMLPLESPAGAVKEDPNFGRVEVYHDSVTLRLAGPGPQSDITLTWQGCLEDSICYPPQDRVIPASTAGSGQSAGANPNPGLVLAQEPGLIEGLSQRGGVTWVLAGFLGFGLLLSFTPCVFPMIPIVAGMVAGPGGKVSPRRGLLLSGIYVLAMASAFAAIGGAAAWSGQNLQVALQSPLALTLAAVLFALLALASFGLFELSMPQALAGRLSVGAGRQGSPGGAAVLGFTSALILGPCVTAPLAGALLYIAQTGDVLLGAAALFALGIGQGLPLLAVGTFGPRILPRAGAWMTAVRAGFGVMFLGFAIWILERVLPGPAALALWSMLLLGTGMVLWRGSRAPLATAVAAVLVLAGGLQGLGAALGADDPLRPLAPLVAARGAAPADPAPDDPAGDGFAHVTTPAALDDTLGRAAGPALIYVTADWCVTCRSIERGPLADPAVQAGLAPLQRIKVDVSDFDDESQALLDRLGSVGPPTMVFLDATRSEAAGSRLLGEIDSRALLASIARVAP